MKAESKIRNLINKILKILSTNSLAKIKTSRSNPDPVRYLIQIALLITWSKSNMARIYNAGLRSVENEI